jgi:hypothetical protein
MEMVGGSTIGLTRGRDTQNAALTISRQNKPTKSTIQRWQQTHITATTRQHLLESS